ICYNFSFFFQAEDGIRDRNVTGVQTCALPISFIQDYIYEHGWQNLRPIQVAAAEEIFETEDNVLLSASTASGKTEAAFFPILSRSEERRVGKECRCRWTRGQKKTETREGMSTA